MRLRGMCKHAAGLSCWPSASVNRMQRHACVPKTFPITLAKCNLHACINVLDLPATVQVNSTAAVSTHDPYTCTVR